ncbi:unnamed protein product [Mycena citricolor]|uniref:Uncharacterized protein n=1 Tax=Mycena citricolor TaxID=2018698 RepID=A0AAD2HA60_9AGAR|nr:unnamed protein product [Mycena citricolor]
MYCSSSLNNKCGRAVNLVNTAEWFQLLGDVLAGKMDYLFNVKTNSPVSAEPPEGFVPKPLCPENIYGTNERGFFPVIGWLPDALCTSSVKAYFCAFTEFTLEPLRVSCRG